MSNGGTLRWSRYGHWHERTGGHYYSLDAGYGHPEPNKLIAVSRTLGVLAVSGPDGDILKANGRELSTQPGTWNRRGGRMTSGGSLDLILESQPVPFEYVRDVTLALRLRVADRVESYDIPATSGETWRPGLSQSETWHRPVEGLLVRAKVDPAWSGQQEEIRAESANDGAGFHVHFDTIVEFHDRMEHGGPTVINAIAVYDDGTTSKPYMCSGPGHRNPHRFEYGFPGGAESERKITAIRVFFAPSSHEQFIRIDFDRFNLPEKPD